MEVEVEVETLCQKRLNVLRRWDTQEESCTINLIGLRKKKLEWSLGMLSLNRELKGKQSQR